MNILVIGGGGREHALCWKIAQSPLCQALFCAPGNAGIASVAQCVALPWPEKNYDAVADWCRERAIDLIVIGPERPLADGMADAMTQAGFQVFGPCLAGAMLEGSKEFAKTLMQEAGIPTAASRTFSDYEAARAYLKTKRAPYVVKAVGLAEGKGVTVAATLEEAEAALHAMLRERRFGESGAEALIEDFLEGEEASLLAFTDGETIAPMISAQDHKRLLDGDAGPNTGGMGAYAPASVLTPALLERSLREVLEPCLKALRARGIHYVGVIYAGLMLGPEGPSVVEFNARFGDPEIQAVLPLMKSDLVEVMLACIKGRLRDIKLEWEDAHAISIVAAAGGYPDSAERGKIIYGLDAAQPDANAVVFHAGTQFDAHGEVVTAGGRVIALTVKSGTLAQAASRAYELMRAIHFENMQYRSDIGAREFARPAPQEQSLNSGPIHERDRTAI